METVGEICVTVDRVSGTVGGISEIIDGASGTVGVTSKTVEAAYPVMLVAVDDDNVTFVISGFVVTEGCNVSIDIVPKMITSKQ